MLIKVYKNVNHIEKYINIKDVEIYFLNYVKKNDNYELLIKTYNEDIYIIAFDITIECYRYIMQKIALSIANKNNLIETDDFQWEFENNTFYNYCNNIFNKYDKKTQEILEKVMNQIEDSKEFDNLYVYNKAYNILNNEEKIEFNNIRNDYKKFIEENLNIYLQKYLIK